MLHEVAHDNNFNSSETDPASMPLRVFASISVTLLGWKAQPTIDSWSSLLSTQTTFSVSNLSSYRLNALTSFSVGWAFQPNNVTKKAPEQPRAFGDYDYDLESF